MPRPAPSRSAALAAAGACLALAACGGSSGSGFTVTAEAIQSDALVQVNLLRAQAGAPALTADAALGTAATRHAGWMARRALGLTHFETTDGTAGGAADTASPLFAAVQPADRVAVALGTPLPVGPTYQEVLTSLGGTLAIRWMWYGAYQRLPLMRAETTAFGYGDQAGAAQRHPGTGIPAGSGFGTALVSGTLPLAPTTAQHWPPHGAIGVERAVNTNAYSPDPLDPANGGQTPATAAITRSGPPLTIIVPTSQDWASITATLTPQGGAAVPLVVLCGGSAAPVGAIRDTGLRVGEIVLIADAPLLADTTYTATLDATTVGGTPDTVSLGIATPWTFTTGP